MPTRILIAEDSPAVRTALRSLFGERRVVGNHRRRKWAGCYSQSPGDEPNLIILDLVMPVMDGLAAARAISKTLPEIPMLMHTMHWSLQVEVEAQKVGMRKVRVEGGQHTPRTNGAISPLA